MKVLLAISALGILMFVNSALAGCKKFKGTSGLYELCKVGSVVAEAVSAYTDIIKRGQAITTEKLLQVQKISKGTKSSQKTASQMIELKREEVKALYKVAYLSMLASMIEQQEYKFVWDEVRKDDIYDFLVLYGELSDKEVLEFCKLLPDRC